jgi:probable HAF family extracellular repeat protein
VRKTRSSAGPIVLWAWALSFVIAVIAQQPSAAPKAPAAPSYSIVELGTLGPRGSIALAINNRGDIGGYSAAVPPGSADWYYHAFLWQNGSMLDLGAQVGAFTFSQVSAINDRGTAVVNGSQGVMTWRDGKWTSLGFFGAVSDINGKDVIVGSYSVGLGGHAYQYNDGVLRDLGTLGGSYSSASAINDKGVVVGTSYLAGDSATRGFIYDNGAMTALGTLGGTSSTAVDINRHGVIVGTAQDASGTWQPFIQDKTGMHILANVPAGSTLFAVNDRGQVIGTYANANNQGSTSFFWEEGVMTPLILVPEVQAAGWTSLFVTDMNDRGWITGWGWKRGGPVEGLAFVLIPK